jgi:hypothetical protein
MAPQTLRARTAMRSLTSVVLLVVASLGRADDTYTIKVKVGIDPGRTATYRETVKGEGSVKGYDSAGKLLSERKREGMETVFRGTLLEADKDGKAKRFLRVYETATETDDGKKKAFSYQGRTILFEKVDGKFRLGLAGESALDAADAEKLYKEVNRKSDREQLLRNLSPGKSVKLGESWAVPVRPIAEALEDSTVDQSKSSVTAKLVNVYQKGTSQFGKFDVTARFVISTMSESGITIHFDPPATFDVLLKLDLAIDGSSPELIEKGEFILKGDGRVTVGTEKRRVVFDMRLAGVSELSAQVYDPKARVVPKVTIIPAPGEWIEFKPKDGMWAAKFPGRPVEISNKADTYTETQWEVEAERGTVAYSVSVTEYADPTTVDPPTTQKSFMDSLNGVRGVKEIQIDGVKGVEFVHEMESNGITFEITQRMVITKQRCISLSVVALKGKKVEAEKFFSSFQILRKPAAKDD